MHKYTNYNIKKKNWEILATTINPSQFTIDAIQTVLNKYGFPKNPSEHKWTYNAYQLQWLPAHCAIEVFKHP